MRHARTSVRVDNVADDKLFRPSILIAFEELKCSVSHAKNARNRVVFGTRKRTTQKLFKSTEFRSKAYDQPKKPWNKETTESYRDERRNDKNHNIAFFT